MFVTHFVHFALLWFICWSEFCHGEKKQKAKVKLKEALKSVEEYKVRNKREVFSADCQDVYHDCSIYEPYCEHDTYKDFVSENCKKTCNLCSKEACQDVYHDCSIYKPYCKHDTYKDFVSVYCKKTCNLCPKECRDLVSYCAVIKSRCQDKVIGLSMRYYCSRTCLVCGVPTTVPPTTIPRTEQPIEQGSAECGIRAVGSRIVGGTNAEPGEWPWQVTMDYTEHNAPHWCGGSIVTPHWIVTAAHCFVYGVDPKEYTIVVGEYDLNGREGYEQNVTIDKIIKHPKYDASRNHDYDVAMIKLKNPIQYNTHVRPVCLAKTEFDTGTNCFITGWGHTKEGGEIPQILQQAEVPLVSRETCQEGYDDLGYTISTRMRCAGYSEGAIDACQGDSGGPLVCVRNNKWFLMGVISWGIGCARKGRYGVYADIMDLKFWVQETINTG